MKTLNEKGFTLVELVIVMAVVALLLSVIIPNLRAMQQEGQLTKAESELQTIKTAIVSYWRNFGNVYPSNIHGDLIATSPTVTTSILMDPFETDTSTTPPTYGYITGTDSTYGPYFAIWTKGPKGDTATVTFNDTNGFIEYSGTGRVSSNCPVKKLPSP